jgi:ribose/xylose/arabinose/galactoside ABC-type transport system permease subunit
MHVKTKKIAISGICLALAMMLILAGSLIDVSSLSFMLLASFVLGIVVNACGL